MGMKTISILWLDWWHQLVFYMPNRGVARIFVWGGGCSNYDTIILVKINYYTRVGLSMGQVGFVLNSDSTQPLWMRKTGTQHQSMKGC